MNLNKPLSFGLIFVAFLALKACSTSLATPTNHWFSPADISPEFGAPSQSSTRLLGVLELHSQPSADADISELSGLAWHESSQTLFGITDRGILHRFRPSFQDDELTGLHWLGQVYLKGEDGKPLSRSWEDSEGIAIWRNGDDPELLVSFEVRPRLVRYSVEGTWLGELALPPTHSSIDHYGSANGALEALTVHPELGWVTGAERPMNTDQGQLRLIAQSNWSQSFSPDPDEHSALTGMTTAENGDLVFLERRFNGLLVPLQIRVRRIRPGSNEAPKTIALFDNAAGWRMDNFEGISRHRGNRYFAVSDDNGNPLQRALLIYFEIAEPS
ncbi:MAG: esterase-like activity of phytase family protein [Gammaproteobacteria bacterium]